MMGDGTLSPSRLESLDELIQAATTVTSGCAVVDATSPLAAPQRLEHLLSLQAIEVPTIVLIPSGEVRTAVRLMKAGAIDVLEKQGPSGALVEQINEQLSSDGFRTRLHLSRSEIRRRLDKLTAGERAVLEGVVAGKANKSIASQLGFSLRTIELWRRNVMNKLEVDSVAELVKLRMQVEPAARPHLRTNGHHFATGTN
jgi:two-component system response regulator FixJ